ncbi:conserved exported protein of unknown function [Burkholderia multivorans]
MFTHEMKIHPLLSPLVAASLAAITALASMQVRAADVQIETIVMVRHGEKPAAGLGQLTCEGLNRALALPRVIEAKYGRPDVIFAPDPARQKNDRGVNYDYVRPLATIEPTAIYFGLPVNASIGFADIDGLRAALLAPAYRQSRVVVAWEHSVIEELARRIVRDYGGDPADVRRWPSDDYDSIYVLRIMRRGSDASAVLSVEQENLDHRPKTCPGD